MATNFRSVISDFWASIGLESPRFGATNAIYLSLEDGSISLEEEEGERSLLVSAVLGPLATDPMRRREQVRWLLQENLVFLASRRACVHAKSGDGSSGIVVASGVHSYDDGVAELSQLIEDVLFLQGRHSGELSRSSEPKPRVSPERYERQDVIFHP